MAFLGCPGGPCRKSKVEREYRGGGELRIVMLVGRNPARPRDHLGMVVVARAAGGWASEQWRAGLAGWRAGRPDAAPGGPAGGPRGGPAPRGSSTGPRSSSSTPGGEGPRRRRGETFYRGAATESSTEVRQGP